MADLNNVRIRPVCPHDKAAILAFCQHSFEDEADYIPYVWDIWVAEPAGHILVAELEGCPIGMTRLVEFSKTEGWWEGLRVDRDYRKRGIGHSLFKAVIEKAKVLGLNTLRTCVGDKNNLMQSFVRHRGWVPQGDYAVYKANAINEPPTSLRLLQPKDFDPVWTALPQLNMTVHQPLFVPQGAKWQSLNKSTLARLLDKGWVWGVFKDKTVESLFIRSRMENPVGNLWIGWVGSSLTGLPATMRDMQCLAHQEGFNAVAGFIPQLPPLLETMQNLGYQFNDKAVYQVFKIDLQ